MKIISGGQIGADLAALQFAKDYGFQTGGWMPRGFKNKNGDNPEFKEFYGMLETDDGGYPARTRLNVQAADVTLRFGHNFKTYGELCTARYIREFNKPHLDIYINPVDQSTKPEPSYVADWLLVYNPGVINIAGNAYPALEAPIRTFLDKVFNIVGMYGT